MKKILLKLCAVVMVVMAPLSMRALNTIIYNATYDLSNLTVGTDTLGGVTYTTVHYDGLYNYGEPGTPSLPVDYIRFSVPWNATNFTVTTSLLSNHIHKVSHMVYPCQPLRLMCDTTPVVIALPDSSAYYSNSYFPTHNAWIADEGFLAGENHIVTVAVMPVSYKHSRIGNTYYNDLKETQTVRLTLSYQLSDSLAMYPIVRQDTALRREGYALTRSMVVNPTNVEAYAPIDAVMDSMGIIIPNPGDGLNWDPNPHVEPIDSGNISHDSINSNFAYIDYYPYVIVTTNELYHSVRRIAALKRQKGYKVKVVTIEEVLNDPDARFGDLIRQPDGTYLAVDTTSAGKLRQYLKNCFRLNGTEYVLLAGTDVPYKRTTFEDREYVTDFCFIDLSADWDEKDESYPLLDHFPELYVGRVLSRTSNQIDNYTDKLFRYELNPGDGDYSYLTKVMLLTGRDFYDGYWFAKGFLGSIYQDIIEFKDSNGNNSMHPNGKDIIDTLNAERIGLASIFNHGVPTMIRTYGEDAYGHISRVHSYSSQSDGNGLNCLTNKKYPMIFYAVACKTVPFDYQSDMNLGESFTTGKDYGGPAYIGYTRKVNSVCIMSLFESFASLLHQGKYDYKLGKIDAFSRESHRNMHPEVLAHAYLGDPSLEIWTDVPQEFSNISLTRTDHSIKISGIDANSTIFACYSNDGKILSDTISTDSVTLRTISPNSTVMLYKHNYIPYIAPLVLQKANLDHSQYVIASDVTAGSNVDSGRTNGDVVVKAGVEYEIEASGTVTLQDGFKVEKGATFAVYPSSF